MATATTSTILGLFASRASAEQAVDALLRAGYSRDIVSIVSSDPRNRTDIPDLGPKDQIGSGADAGTGAAIGGIAGFIGGIVALAIPGIGPIIAAGPLAAGIMGAGIGAATGGVVGALKSSGVPENDASRFTEAIRRGRVLVTVHAPEDRVDNVAEILDRHGAIDVDEPEENVPLMKNDTMTEEPIVPRATTPEMVEAARLKPGESLVERQRDRERRVYVYPGVTGGGTMPTA